jgi:hypothetical protein
MIRFGVNMRLAKQYSRLAERVDHDAAESDLRATAAQNFNLK